MLGLPAGMAVDEMGMGQGGPRGFPCRGQPGRMAGTEAGASEGVLRLSTHRAPWQDS